MCTSCEALDRSGLSSSACLTPSSEYRAEPKQPEAPCRVLWLYDGPKANAIIGQPLGVQHQPFNLDNRIAARAIVARNHADEHERVVPYSAG